MVYTSTRDSSVRVSAAEAIAKGISADGGLDGEIYGAMPTGMESTIKVRVGGYLLTGVVFGSTLFRIGAKVRVRIGGDNVMLFDRRSGRRVALGSLEFVK